VTDQITCSDGPLRPLQLVTGGPRQTDHNVLLGSPSGVMDWVVRRVKAHENL